MERAATNQPAPQWLAITFTGSSQEGLKMSRTFTHRTGSAELEVKITSADRLETQMLRALHWYLLSLLQTHFLSQKVWFLPSSRGNPLTQNAAAGRREQALAWPRSPPTEHSVCNKLQRKKCERHHPSQQTSPWCPDPGLRHYALTQRQMDKTMWCCIQLLSDNNSTLPKCWAEQFPAHHFFADCFASTCHSSCLWMYSWSVGIVSSL